jgi:hypothetical protein
MVLRELHELTRILAGKERGDRKKPGAYAFSAFTCGQSISIKYVAVS